MNRIILYMAVTLLLCIGTGARAANTVTISSAEGSPGEEVTVSIGLENTDVVSSLQVSIPLDEDMTLVSNSGQKGSRCDSHSLTIGVKDGVLNIFVYSVSMAPIAGNSGEVASFRLKLGSQPQSVSLTPSKTVLTNGNGTSVEATAESGTVTTRCAKAQYSKMEVDFGEVPIRDTYEQTVTVTNVGNDDLTITNLEFSDINVFSTTTTLPLTVAPGASKELNITYEPVERGIISRTMKVSCNSVSKLNTITLKAQPFAVNELHVQPASGISDEEVTIQLTMNNMDAISGFQIEFTLPEQLEYVENSFVLSDRKQDHTVIASLTDNVLRFISYSGNDLPFTGNDGVIGSFKVKLAGRYGTTLTPTKTVLSATINNHVDNVMSAVYGGDVSISSPEISCDNSLSFGAVSVTEACERAFTIRNYGSAPLTISRIVFDNEALGIKETLPMVIPAGGDNTVTVTYSSVEQAAFNASMQIYSNDPDMRMKSIEVSGSRFAPNYVGVNTPDIVVSQNLGIEVSANIYDDIAAVQFDMVYPSTYFEPFANNYKLEERAEGMTVQMLNVDNNTLRVFCYFLNGGSLAAGEGKIMTLLLKPKADVDIPENDYQISIKNIKLSTSQMTDKYAGTDITSTFNVEAFMLGDVNKDGIVNVSDAVDIVEHYIEGRTSELNIIISDVDGNGVINVSDAVEIVDMYINNE